MGPDGKEERSVEMGAIMGAKTYYAVHEAEEFGGVSHEDGPSMSHIYRDSAQTDLSLRGQEISPSRRLFFGFSNSRKRSKKLAHLLETKYVGYDVNGHRGVAEGRYDGLDKTVRKR
jgi:hypothetical protein